MITQDYTTVSGAYGKDYSNAEQAKLAFLSGKDFKMESILHGVDAYGTYCSIRDFKPGVTVNVRYARLTKVVPVVVPMTPSKRFVDVIDIENFLARVNPDTLILCVFYKADGSKLDSRLVRLGDCNSIAKVIEGCASWQPFLAMHRANPVQ